MTVHSLDKRRVRRAFSRAARSYDGAAVFQREVANRLMAHLDDVRITPTRILDGGAGTGYCAKALARRYGGLVVALDSALAMAGAAARTLRWTRAAHSACGDLEAIPLADASVDLACVSLALQWCDAARALAELRRVLAGGGLLTLASLGPASLAPVREAWEAVDGDAHVHPFLDLHDLGDALVTAGFADVVLDVDRLQVSYGSVASLLTEVRALGVGNADPERRQSLTGKSRFRAFEAALAAHAQDGRLVIPYEVVYAQAWVPAPSRPAPLHFHPRRP